jgi:hypothetical protein
MVHPGSPYRTFRHTTAVVPPVADGPDVSPISACGDGEPEAIHTLEKTRTTNITRHEAEPAFSGSVIVATSLHAVDPLDPNHDADIRIGSEAPKQRCPFLITA